MIPPPTLRDFLLIALIASGIYAVIQSPLLGAQTFERIGEVTRTTFDVDRCVELHNAIIREMAEPPGHEPWAVANYTDHWADKQGSELELLKTRLKAPMFEFLSRSHVVVDHDVGMTPFAWGLTEPSRIYSTEGFLPFENYGDLVVLYKAAASRYSAFGLVFDMNTNKATWINLWWYKPPEYKEYIWAPLDVILEAWLAYIRRRAVPRGFDGDPEERDLMMIRTEGWGLLSPPPQDVEEDLEVWDRYVALVESKLPESANTAVANTSKPELDFLGFPQAFFSRARRPTFKYVAPELVFPAPSQMSALAKQQRALWVMWKSGNRRKEYDPELDFDIETASDRMVAFQSVLFPLGENIEAGLSTSENKAWQDGVGLILPESGHYDLEYREGNRRHWPPFKRVWQVEARESPFWAPHPARLARVLEKWIQFVEDGTWKVGKDGIKGKINSFLKHEVQDGWKGVELTAYGMLLDGVDAS
ncbi:hypothetical protein BJX63DRAFT_402635 [Aspergillus granulosus]|uniref:Uncharacterized protein n=1 Tax=Aspergillus granulosus TaxID=176169 RepID=A0ABR4H412_9EURO